MEWDKVASEVTLNLDTVIIFSAEEPDWKVEGPGVPTSVPATASSVSQPAAPSRTAMPPPCASQKPTAPLSASASAFVRPAPTPAPSPSVSTGRAAVPAPVVPEISGYQGGRVIGCTYYSKMPGASGMYCRKKSSGSLGRVSAPYARALSDARHYLFNCGGIVRFRSGCAHRFGTWYTPPSGSVSFSFPSTTARYR